MLYHLKKLRPLMPKGESEYVIRRTASRLIPVKQRVPYDALLHCCAWKTGSQWVRLILSDPRFFRHTGLLPNPMFWRAEIEADPVGHGVRRGRVATNFFCDVALFDAVPKPQNYRVFYVCRDPLSLLFSWYFSKRYSHDGYADIQHFRRETEGMDHEAGLIYSLERFDDVASQIVDWTGAAGRERGALIVKYESLTGNDQFSAWRKLMSDLEIDIPDQILQDLLQFYRKENLRPKNPSITDKYGSLWKKEISPSTFYAVMRAFEAKYPNLRQTLDYPTSDGEAFNEIING